jgi:nucleoside-diphosphate-sugar epimerase
METLLARGFLVRGLVRKFDASRPPGAEFVQVEDMCSPPVWERVLENVNVVIHLAARAHIVDERSDNPIEAFREVNVGATGSLFRACQRAAVSRFVFVSSIGVNGVLTRGRPFSELDVPMPVEAYGRSKWEAEQLLGSLKKDGSTDVVILRPALMYGPRVKGNLLRMMRWVRRGWPIPLGSASSARSFLSLSDFCDLLIRCVTNAGAANELFLAADPRPITTVGMIEAIARQMDRPARFIKMPPSALRLIGSLAGKSRELNRLTDSLIVDCSKAKIVLGWPDTNSSFDDMKGMIDEFLRNESGR